MKVIMSVRVLALVTAVRGASSNSVEPAVGYGIIVSPAQAESHQVEATLPDSESAGAKYLTGKWGCLGAFASGRALAADLEFVPALGGRWLRYTHNDRPPGQYQAVAMWGPLPTVSGTLTTALYDNGGGQRRFLSDGWRDEAIVWTRDSTDANARPERFIYHRMTDTTFSFAWEVQRLSGAAWSVGDSLTCQRKQPG